MIKLHFEMISKYDRPNEFAETAVPFPLGALHGVTGLTVCDGERRIRPQARATATWPDGSVKWAHISFPADLPGRAEKDFFLSADGEEPNAACPTVSVNAGSLTVDTGVLRAVLAAKGSARLFENISGPCEMDGGEIEGPFLKSEGKTYGIRLTRDWDFTETGPYRVVAQNGGRHFDADGESLFDFEVALSFTAGHPWFQIEYRFIHREKAERVTLDGLAMRIRKQNPNAETALGISNYATKIYKAAAADGVAYTIDAGHMMYDANEHKPECFYGTFFADWRDERGGVCVTVFQAHQNFPKALKADADGIEISIIPEDGTGAVIFQGMSKTHHIFVHPHAGESIETLNVRSLQMQLPDKPVLDASVYKSAGIMEDVLPDTLLHKLEAHLTDQADSVSRAYGMMCWGDSPDPGYTKQGRGGGRPVWTNGEYDYAHSCFLMLARTGERRFLDMLLVSARHWMDVDICHYSEDPLRSGAQIEHSADHVTGDAIPSHEWVEGLLDYYHLTADERGYRLALGIGENILRHLETPVFNQTGALNAREMGWALRSLSALFTETGDDKWLVKCERIVNEFEAWRSEMGGWLSPYTDHSAIRVPFMIAIAAGSLMRYYRVRPSARIKDMIVGEVSDLARTMRRPDGFFYYKGFPSLRNVSVNAIVLEALAYAYELTGDKSFLEAGLVTFNALLLKKSGGGHSKKLIENEIIIDGASRKGIAQCAFPLSIYANALGKAGLSDKL